MVEAVSLIALHFGVAPDIITFSLMNIQIMVAMKEDFIMRANSLVVGVTCIFGVVFVCCSQMCNPGICFARMHRGFESPSPRSRAD